MSEQTAARLVAHPEPGKVWVQIPHHNDIGSDWIAVDELPASVPPTQPAAAPETDTLDPDRPYASLTFAEVLDDYVLVRGDLSSDYARKQLVREHEERVRVVEGERDAAMAETEMALRMHDVQWSRAESAEAANAALVAAVEALADEWVAATCITDGAPCTFHRHAAGYAADLRALLAGGEE